MSVGIILVWNIQEDNAADVVQSNDIKGNLVYIYIEINFYVKESKRKIQFCSLFSNISKWRFLI